MSVPPNQSSAFSFSRFIVSALVLILVAAGISLLFAGLFRPNSAEAFPASPHEPSGSALDEINAVFEKEWSESGVEPVPRVDDLTLARRLSLGLIGAIPSLEELRRLERTPSEQRIDAWLDHLFSGQRYASYMAERLARVYVGVEGGPFLVYRRRRMVNWIADQLATNRPYDEMARDLISSKGIWTTSPAANFITVTSQDGGDGPDEVKLAARTSRAFLGVSLDCMQCHDDKFGDRWKQKDFHQLAAFFSQSEVAVSGVWDNPNRDYKMKYRGQSEAEPVSMIVPFQQEILEEKGSPRDRLGRWITHSENRSFSRAVANRAWALLMGRPLVTPIDDIPIDSPAPPALDILAETFVESGHDLQALFRVIAHSKPFLRASRSDDSDKPVTLEQEKEWAAFPLTQLRPDQVSGSIVQASSVQALDSSSHILKRMTRYFETAEFVNRYGDKGENEFVEESGTIPQRLVLMNGKLVAERTAPNPVLNTTTRIGALAKRPVQAVETAFLAVLTRRPGEQEAQKLTELLKEKTGDARQRALQDIFWALINSTEFSWNR